MRALFGVVSLLLVLAIVGIVVTRQNRALQTALPASAAASQAPLTGTPAEQGRKIEQRVRDDVAKAMDQAASAVGSVDDK